MRKLCISRKSEGIRADIYNIYPPHVQAYRACLPKALTPAKTAPAADDVSVNLNRRGRRVLVCVFATKRKRAGGPRAAEKSMACECLPGPGCSVDAGDVEDGSWPAEAAQCVDPGHDAAIGAAECACVVS